MGPERVLTCCREGVDAVVAAAPTADAAWHASTPCDAWDATMLAAHLRTTADRYHRLLDLAVAGEPEAIVTGADLAQRNAEMLAALRPADGPHHIEVFATAARSYAEGLPDHWHVAPYLRGWDHSAGDHAGVAAAEWHIHAWDLARSVGAWRRPSDPELIATVWRQVLPWLVGELDDEVADPWTSVLRASGRAPVPEHVVDAPVR